MSLIARKNQYLGVNAHANSWLQVHNLWRSFHTNHITHLTEAINEALPAGYMAVTEHSLQVSRLLPDQDEPETRRPRPDITVFDRQRRDRAIPTLLQPGAGILTPTIQTMDIHESELSATVIYRLADHAMLGRPVTRVELLSPTNKLPFADYADYQNNRNTTLLNGIPLVEIDYLHHQPPVNMVLPVYPAEEGSHPHSITVHDPRPSIYEGKTRTIPFDVDQAIPPFLIPLNGDDRINAFDLGAVYDHTFATSPLLWEAVDYDSFPPDLERYSRADRVRIGDRLRMIDALREAGKNLDKDGPFPIDYDLIGNLDQDPLDFIDETDAPPSPDLDIM